MMKQKWNKFDKEQKSIDFHCFKIHNNCVCVCLQDKISSIGMQNGIDLRTELFNIPCADFRASARLFRSGI